MSATLQRLLRPAGFFALQTAVWVVLTFAFATLIEVAGYAAWTDALEFSAVQWAPWVAIAPLVFWLARRFPLERGHLWRSVPVHALACLACSVLAISSAAYFTPAPRPPGERFGFGSERAGPRNGGMRDGGEHHSGQRTASVDRPADLPPDRPTDEPAGPGTPPPTGPLVRNDPASRAARADWWRDRREMFRYAPLHAGRDHERGFGAGPFRGGSTPPAPTGVSGLLRHWAFLSSFWPPFGTAILRVNFSAALYLIIAAVAHAIGYYRSAKDRQAQALALTAGLNRAKLDALRLQLHPHFLFNTLNAISTLVHRSPDAADELIADLSELLRLSLQTADHEVPLSRELELLDCYLAIEQTRLGDRLKIVRDIDPAVRAALVPTFVLQPLAENAIRHGLEPRKEIGTLTISAHRVDDALRIVVADDGVGIGALAGSAPRRGVGLANTEERLRTLHGPAARLEIAAPESGGVAVALILPLRTTPAAPPAPTPA